MLVLKNSPTQALWWLTILAGCYPLLEGFIDRFCHGFASFDGLEGSNYDSILVIVNRLTKMVHYKPMKITIDASGFAEVIINMVVRHHGLPDLIVTNKRLLFISKSWSLLSSFLGIKWRLFIAFHPQTNGQTERQNSTMEAYLWAFVNFN